MNKNNLSKLLFIIVLVVFAAALVFPPKDKLRAGIDIAGGTSIIYQIDVVGMEPREIKGLAQRMIPIIRRRIDPANVANIVMRPQGDTRIEIQLPLASEETQTKRKAYTKALTELEDMNINLKGVLSGLSADAATREEKFSDVAGDDVKRAEILSELASAYGGRKQAQTDRDTFGEIMESSAVKIDEAGLKSDTVKRAELKWSKLSSEKLGKEIDIFVGDKADAKKLVSDYITAYKRWATAVNSLATPETGFNARYVKAVDTLKDLNLSMDMVTDILNLDATSAKRPEMIGVLKDTFADRSEKITEVVDAFAVYNKVGGRLDDPEDLKRMLKGSGVLEFRILPRIGDPGTNEAELNARVEMLSTKGPKQASNNNYVWCEIENPEENKINGIVGTFGEKTYVLASNRPKECMLHTGDKEWSLAKAYSTQDQLGRRAIGFSFDAVAASMFYKLSSGNLQRPLCILLDDMAITAPNLRSAIRDSGIIEGTFSQVEINDTVNKLNAGSLQASLSDVPIAEKTIGSTLGESNRNSGIKAGQFGLALVAVFMIVYYFLAGVIAVVALCMNLLFILAMMVLFQGTFTLPGIAGLILTIGMSVDANVLIFERIREEQSRGASLRTAIANGYQKAFRTIFDANITTFFVALILYVVASEEIKGFAIVLMLGIASSMFTALFATRVIFDTLMDAKLIKNQLKWVFAIGRPKVNWMGLSKVFVIISVVFVVGGLAIFSSRDESENSKFDIEFTGGYAVQIDLLETAGLTADDVRTRVAALTAVKVYPVGDTGLSYEITTTDTNKTIASVTFDAAGETVESVTAAIKSAVAESSGSLYNLTVTQKDNTFVVSTSQVNKMLVRNTLNKAFEGMATISEPEVEEVVSKVIKEAFEGLLDVQQDLGITVVSIEPVTEGDVELSDYLGGIKITCKLNKSTTMGDLQDRLNSIRFKPDMQDLSWYQDALFGADYAELDPDAEVDAFVFASVHPEAGYRQLSVQENAAFIANEKEKIVNAASLQQTLARVTQIDPSIGTEAKTQALIAIILSLFVIVAYVWIRFGTARYGIAAIVALVHDVCITLGAVTACYYFVRSGSSFASALGLMDFKIDLAMIAAFLTIIGYSLNDTIVVFDRIRENRGESGALTAKVVSDSINQTLGRTLLTSVTTFIVVLVMYIWGGPGLRGFTFAMLIGIIVGTYSSIAIAAPILLFGSKETVTKD